MKKRRIQWSFGNPQFQAYAVDAVAGSLVARRNHMLVRTGARLCQGWDLWLDGKFAGALSSRTLADLVTLERAELLRAVRSACCGRHHDFQPDQPRLLARPKGGARPQAGRRPRGEHKRTKLGLTLPGALLAQVDAQRGSQTRSEYIERLLLTALSPSSVT